MATYFRPDNLRDAIDRLSQADLVIAAGCTDLFPATDRPMLDGAVLDITAIDALRGITQEQDCLRIGATTRWSDLIRTPLPPGLDMLKQAAAEIGSVQIQNAGTIAGNICNASPAADAMPCLMALEARIEIASRRGTRQMALAEFVTGPRQTALAADELVTAILIPTGAMAGRSRFLKLGARRHLVISIVMVAVRLEIEAGRIVSAAISVGACGPVATRLTALEERLQQRPANALLAAQISDAAIAPALSPIGDIRADAPYRSHAAAELVRRAVTSLVLSADEAAA